MSEKEVKSSQSKKELAAQGKRNRAAGARFELKVRETLKKAGWLVDKWTNNVDLEKQEIVMAKRKYNPFKKALVIGTGFPDFIAFKKTKKGYDVIGIEVKRNGYLSYEEKLKCKFYLERELFSKIFVARAKKEGKRIEVDLIEFREKYKKKYDELE